MINKEVVIVVFCTVLGHFGHSVHSRSLLGQIFFRDSNIVTEANGCKPKFTLYQKLKGTLIFIFMYCILCILHIRLYKCTIYVFNITSWRDNL
jgi:hypothetical protein